jgi:hypothetical protein
LLNQILWWIPIIGKTTLANPWPWGLSSALSLPSSVSFYRWPPPYSLHSFWLSCEQANLTLTLSVYMWCFLYWDSVSQTVT